MSTDMQTKLDSLNIKGLLSRKAGKSPEKGAEDNLWAIVSTDTNNGNWKNFQGNYYSGPYGKPEGQTKRAKDESMAKTYVIYALTKELIGESSSDPHIG